MKCMTWPHLYSTKCVQQMRIMTSAGTYTSRAILADLYEIQNLLSVHSLQISNKLNGSEAPVDTRHPQVLCHTVFLFSHKETKINQASDKYHVCCGPSHLYFIVHLLYL